MNYYTIKGIIPYVHYETGKVNNKELMNTLIQSDERNNSIGSTVGRAYKSRFIILSSSYDHMNFIEREISNESIFKLDMDSLNEFISGKRTRIPRIIGMSFKVFNQIISSDNINDRIKFILFSNRGFIIGTPQKSIDTIVNFINDNKLRSSIYGVEDSFELFTIWSKYHKDKIKRINMEYRNVKYFIH